MTVQSKSALHADVTPPGSFTASPLTPPPTDEKSSSVVLRILEDIRKVKTGGGLARVPVPWAAYKLNTEGYRDLQQCLQRDESLAGFAEHELRLDYFPSTSRLVLRMPGDTHERFIAKIVEEIQGQLKAIRGSSAAFAKQIHTGASSRIKFYDSNYGSHDPDAQFQHLNAQYPGVVIEVSHTQKRRDLPHLADDYILGSDTNIQVVVGLDIEYGRDYARMATISVWEPAIEVDEAGEDCLVAQQTVANQMFRDSNGNTVSSPSSDLRIPLRDFAPDNLFDGEGIPQGEIVISASKMCEFLRLAETQAAVIKGKTGVVKSEATKSWKKKRRREITPAEELHERDEKRFKTEEDEAAQRDAMNDSDYKPSV